MELTHSVLKRPTPTNFSNREVTLLHYLSENIPKKFQIENFDINWQEILKFDPLKCALSLICELTAGADIESPEATNIKALIQ